LYGDLAHFFPGRDPLGEWRAGRMPLIELAALYGWLPPESRTKTAQAGDRADRRWSEREWLQAAQVTYMQAMVRILWVGMRIKGKPPEFKAVNSPGSERELTPAEQEKRREHQARVAQLRRYSPSYRPDHEEKAG
jgi:hypothetical protein